MQDFRDFRGRGGELSARYRLGGIGGSVRPRVGEDGSLVERTGFESTLHGRIDGGEYSPAGKFEWECLMDGRRNEYEHRRTRRSVIEEREGNRFREFRGRDDLYNENMSLEIERECELLRSCQDGGPTVDPHLVDRDVYLPANKGYSGKVEVDGQQEEELTRRGKYLHGEGVRSFYSDKGSCRTVPLPSHCWSSQPGNSCEAVKTPRAGKVEFASFSQDDIGPGFQSDYAPLPKTSQYQPQCRTPLPLCTSKQSEYSEKSLLNEESIEGNLVSRRCFVGDDRVGIRSGKSNRCVTSSSNFLRSNAATPLSVGYGSEEGEYVSVRESPVTENIAYRKQFHRDDGTKNYSDFVHSYMMPSPHSNSKTLTPQSIACASPDREHAFMPKQAVVIRTGREKYFNEEDGPSNHADGLHHVLPSPPIHEPKTMPSLSISRASGPVAKSSARPLPKPQQCPRSTPPVVPSYSSVADTEFSHESPFRVKELHSKGLDPDACACHCRKEDYCTRDEKCAFYEADVGMRYVMSSNELHGKFPSNTEDYGSKDRFWVHDKNGEDACGHSHEPKSKSGMVLQHHQSSQEQEFLIHPHASVESQHHNRDYEVLHHNILPHDVKTKAHYHEDRKSAAYEVQQGKFNQLDNDPDVYHKDGDFYIDKRQSNILNTGHSKYSPCCDSGLHGNSRAILRGRYRQDNCFTFNEPYIKHQEHLLERARDDDELEHLSSEDIDCQMLMRRSAHIQNKDFTRVADEALDNSIRFECRLPFKKLPLRMRLGKLNNPAVCNIKKRLKSAHQISDTQFSKKHKSSNTAMGIHYMREPYQGYKSDPSPSKETSEITELDENSEKFKELVNRAFLEYVKHLFESSVQQRKYKGLDKYESLRCDICHSSREYKDTHSLAKHAYSYVRKDLRAQHLGFHKALCVLLGWKSTVKPDNPMNLLDLSESEHLAVKEDLIIWPSVVIVHNSSVENKDLRKQKIITIRKLESILEGEGFGGNNHKVHIGNDQGVMVVRFTATLSGLQAARELHKFYAENKRGRDEFQDLTPNGGCSIHEESQKATPKIEDILYGYLGTVEDLPRLDSQIKKWSLIKSKKELLGTAP